MFGNRRVGSDDGAVSNMDAGHNCHVLSNPHVIADDGIAFLGQFGKMLLVHALPLLQNGGKGISANGVHVVICRIHDEADVFAQGAEFADNQLVPKFLVMIQDAVFFKIFHALFSFVVGEIPDLNIGILDDVFDVADVFQVLVGMQFVGVHCFFLCAVHSSFVKRVMRQVRVSFSKGTGEFLSLVVKSERPLGMSSIAPIAFSSFWQTA